MNLVARALALARAQHYRAAIELLEPAHAAAPGDPQVAEVLAFAYLGDGYLDDAAEVLATTHAAGVDTAALRCAWGLLAWRRGNYAQARQQYEAALLMDHRSPAAHLGLGRWYAHHGDDALAARYFEGALAREGGRDAAVHLAELRTKAGDVGAAAALLRTAAQAPRPLLADFETDAILLRLADAEVLDARRRASAPTPPPSIWVTILALATVALVVLSMGALPPAWGAAAHLAQGKERLDLFDYHGCIDDMQQALVSVGVSAKAWAYEGVCYELARDHPHALTALQQAYALDPHVQVDDPRESPPDRIKRMRARAQK